MTVNLNTFGGYIKDGNYDVIIAQGTTVLSPSVTFDTLLIKGIMRANGCTGRQIRLEGGMLDGSGSIDADCLSGHGHIHMSGSIQVNRIDFIGELIVDDQLRCDGTLNATGLLTCHSFQSQRSHIAGHVRIADTSKAIRFEIASLYSTMFERFGMLDYLKPSTIQGIEANTVILNHTVCDSINADTVRLSGNTRVGKVRYEQNLDLDRTSNVTLIESNWRRDNTPELQRKVA